MKRLNAVVLAMLCQGGLGVATAQDAIEAQSPPESVPASPPESQAALPSIPVDPVAEPAAPEPTRATGSRLIEEVIVTAQRREENIKDVPISISAFSPDFLEAKGVVAQQDLPKVTPGLTIGSPVGFATAYIRGVGSDAFILADPLVVTYIDGVYFPASTTQFQEFGDVEQVEISKGPQGTLFGRNALGGVISITSKSPSLTDVEGKFKTSYTAFTGSDASRNARNASGFVSIPLHETFAFSVSALVGENDPYYDVQVGPVGDRKQVRGGDSYAYRIKTLWQPTEDFNLKLNVYRSYTNDPQRNVGIQTNPSALGGGVGDVNLLLQPQDPFKGGTLNDVPYSRDRTLNYFGSIDWSLDLMKVQVLGARQRILAERNADFDGTPLPIAYFEDVDRPGDPYRRPFFSNSTSGEIRFLSNDSAPDWLELVGGLYYYEQKSGVGGANFVATGSDLSLGQIAGVQVPGLQQAYADTILPALQILGLEVLPTGVNLALRGGLKEKAESIYGQGTVKFTDWVSLTLGARYQQTKRSVLFADQLLYVSENVQIPIQQNSGADNPDYRAKTSSTDPKAVLSFHPGSGLLGKDPLVYVSYQTATVGSTFNTVSLLQPPTPTKGTKITAYEGGLKTFLFDRINFDAAVFYYKQDDPQTQVVSLQSGGAVHFENAGGIETKGAEFSIVAPVLPSLTADGLVMTLGVSYLDSTYSSYPNASGFDELTGVYSNNYDFSGNRVVQTPKFTVAAGLNQTFQFDNGTLDFGVDYYYNDGYFFLAQNSKISEVPHYQTVGLTASYLYQPWDVRINVFGRNILNEEYLAGRFVNDFGVIDYATQKSSVGISLQWEF